MKELNNAIRINISKASQLRGINSNISTKQSINVLDQRKQLDKKIEFFKGLSQAMRKVR